MNSCSILSGLISQGKAKISTLNCYIKTRKSFDMNDWSRILSPGLLSGQGFGFEPLCKVFLSQYSTLLPPELKKFIRNFDYFVNFIYLNLGGKVPILLMILTIKWYLFVPVIKIKFVKCLNELKNIQTSFRFVSFLKLNCSFMKWTILSQKTFHSTIRIRSRIII